MLLLVAAFLSAATIINAQDTYIAAAGQHSRLKEVNGSEDPLIVMMANLNEYTPYLQKAVEAQAQIIVFPELGLGCNEDDRSKNAGFGEDIPSADENINPCLSNSSYCSERPILCNVSCVSRRYSLYMIVGMVDIKPCNESCHSDGIYIYNTAVVFDPTGLVIARYHKKHITTPFPVFDVPAVAEIVTFNTSFGVIFGVFVCLDMLFPDPPMSLLSLNISHFVFPTSWINIPPILTATQYQQAWSGTFHTVLIAANNGLDQSTSGSGIYVNGEGLTVFFNASLTKENDNRLLIATVPVHYNNSNNNDNSNNSNDIDSNINNDNKYSSNNDINSSQFLDSERKIVSVDDIEGNGCGLLGVDACNCSIIHPQPGATHTITAVFGNVSCSAVINVNIHSPFTTEKHALIAYSGTAWFIQPLPVQLCSFVRCLDGPSCMLPDPYEQHVYDTVAIFDSITVTGTFCSEGCQLFPMIASTNGKIFSEDEFELSDGQFKTTSTFSPSPLLAAGIFVRKWNTTSTE